MAETVIWAIVFVGGDLAVLVALLGFAIRKDKQKLAAESCADRSHPREPGPLRRSGHCM